MWKIKAECALKSSRAPFKINIWVSLNLINVVTTLYRWQGGSDMKGTLEGENELLTPKKKHWLSTTQTTQTWATEHNYLLSHFTSLSTSFTTATVHDITKIPCYNIYYHTELLHPVKRAGVSRILLFLRKFCVKTSFILSWLKPLLYTFTYKQNVVIEL